MHQRIFKAMGAKIRTPKRVRCHFLMPTRSVQYNASIFTQNPIMLTLHSASLQLHHLITAVSQKLQPSEIEMIRCNK